MKIVVLGINYAPEPSGIAPYTHGMVTGLAARGHDVSVITTFPHYPHWRFLDGRPPRTTEETSGRVTVRRRRHYVPSIPTGVRRAVSELRFPPWCAEGGRRGGATEWDTSKPDGTPQKLLDVSKLSEAGWSSRISMRSGLESTVEWYRRQEHLRNVG